MVRVTLERIAAVSGGENKRLMLRVEGHSGFGASGNDVVCAGISAITQTALVAITKVAGIRQDLDHGEGFLESRIELDGLDESRRNSLNVIIDTMLAGLEEIEKENPGSLSISIRRT
ncbi:MAG TPA: ribosomal-processing cysteine protease Prp [Spirochaetota bacterium]|nr:MAG: hypothetical protein BWY96_01234 [Spirochaetes bacterium ADurb.BinA120]HPI15068.1 ribosomal-processing cysteine protease Prp [Spirochaetota bacterium]HPO46162.1 ribosomal-processing cysteine protease Prp [Spirochaetota bacterium]